MARLGPILSNIFGSLAGTNQISKFGSLYAGSAQYTTDPEQAQSLSNWLTGWFAAAIGGAAPAIEDMNAVHFAMSYQLAYLQQAGVPEWVSTATYYIGSIVNDGSGNLYVSLTNSNVGNALTSSTNWRKTSSTTVKVETSNYQILAGDKFIQCNAASGAFTVTLPDATLNTGASYDIKKIDSSANTVTIAVLLSQPYDGPSSLTIQGQYLTVRSDGTGWNVTDTGIPVAPKLVANTTTQNLTSGSNVPVVYTSSVVDNFSGYNNSTGVYTVKRPGFYQVSALLNMQATPTAASTQGELDLLVNSSTVASQILPAGSSGTLISKGFVVSVGHQFALNDTVNASFFNNFGGTPAASGTSSFSMVWICP